MGMYTDLVCTAIIKEEYRDRVNKVVFESSLDKYENSWEDLFKEKWADGFVLNGRACLIPFGDNNLEKSEIFDGVKLHIECSIKNYTNTYEEFYEFLNIISDEIIEFKTLYEENYEYDYEENICTASWFNFLNDRYEYVEQDINY